MIDYAGSKHSHHYWVVQCRCGTAKPVRESDLVRGITKSCGCRNQQVNPIDYTGLAFEVLRVTGRAPNTGGHRYWLCRCECGKERAIREYSLTSGAIGSCGCARKRIRREIGKANRIHGHSFGGRGSKWSQLPSALRVELSRYSIRGKWDRRGRRGEAFKRARRERIRINAARRKTGPPGLIR
jgi:hypothetical protein